MALVDDKAQLLLDHRLQKDLRLACEFAGHTTRGLAGKTLGLEQKGDFRLCLGGAVPYLIAFVGDLRQIDLALALRGEVLAGRHGEDAGQRGRDPSDDDRVTLSGRAADRADDGEGAHQAVLHSEKRLTNLAE